MSTIYNEIDAFPSQWLRNLSNAGHIAKGTVLERSILDLTAADVSDAVQAHFFAGIGVWSYALRLAGVPDTAKVWTGSCPCQPFSVAGKQGGLSDDRHLWPIWRALIAQCFPPVLFGEQVASPAGRAWLSVVQADLEALGYRVAAADLCAAGVGAPHIRSRLFFGAVRMDHTGDPRLEGHPRHGDAHHRQERTEAGPHRPARAPGVPGGVERLGHPGSKGGRRDSRAVPRAQAQGEEGGCLTWRVVDELVPAGAVRGFWSDVDWLFCRDGKTRPVEAGTLPVAHGAPGRMGRLRAYGNAIVPQVAADFITAFLSACE